MCPKPVPETVTIALPTPLVGDKVKAGDAGLAPSTRESRGIATRPKSVTSRIPLTSHSSARRPREDLVEWGRAGVLGIGTAVVHELLPRRVDPPAGIVTPPFGSPAGSRSPVGFAAPACAGCALSCAVARYVFVQETPVGGDCSAQPASRAIGDSPRTMALVTHGGQYECAKTAPILVRAVTNGARFEPIATAGALLAARSAQLRI